jgi:hypothetical protein
VPVDVKTIGASGQISLGKQHAGKTVAVEELGPGVWMIKTAQVIPDSELWLHTPEVRASLDRALEWSETHERSASNLRLLERKAKIGK